MYKLYISSALLMRTVIPTDNKNDVVQNNAYISTTIWEW